MSYLLGSSRALLCRTGSHFTSSVVRGRGIFSGGHGFLLGTRPFEPSGVASQPRVFPVLTTLPVFSREFNTDQIDFSDSNVNAINAENLLNSLEPGQLEAASSVGGIFEERGKLSQAVRLLKTAVDEGSPRGKTLLAFLLRDGNGVDQDCEHAEKLFYEAADLGDPFAQVEVGNMLMASLPDVPEHLKASLGRNKSSLSPEGRIVVDSSGSGAPSARFEFASERALEVETPADLVRKVRKARRKAGFTDDQALEYEEYKRKQDDAAVSNIRETALSWYRRAHGQGNVEAGVALANALFKNSPSESFELYKEAAIVHKLPAAHYNLGQIYRDGIDGAAPDFKAAFKHFAMAAQLGDVDAQFYLGHAYRVGEMGLDPDQASSRQFVELAAAQEHPGALYYLSLLHRNGDGGLEVSRGSFRRYLEASAKLGHSDALAMVAEMFYKGTDGSSVDLEKALRYFSDAGAAGNNEALCSAAAMHFHGIGTAVDMAKAFSMYQEGVVRGSVQAMQNIGAMYFNGHGVPKNVTVAEHFLKMVDELQEAEKREADSLANAGGTIEEAPRRSMPHSESEAQALDAKLTKDSR